MRTNVFKVSMFAIAATLMTACSQNDDWTNEVAQPEQHVLAEVNTIIQDYTPEIEGRVVDVAGTDGGYTTTFENGDEIGVFAILDNGSGDVMRKNMKMTYDGSKWTGESPLYFYRNAKYIAYSPYNASLAPTENTVDAIKTWFSTNVTTGTYEERDLMTAEVTSGTDITQNNLTFSFAHAMSMVEFVLPVAQYKTSAGYEYSAPIFGIELKMQNGTNAEETVTTISLGKGVYRSLLTPDANASYKFSGTAFVGDGTQPVYFATQTAFVPTAGKFKKVNITWDGAPSTTVQTREIAVGDYFYSDGGIVPNDATVVPQRNLVGIVFSTTTCQADQERGWKNGYVVSVVSKGKKWGELGLADGEWATVTDENLSAFLDLNVYELTANSTNNAAATYFLNNFSTVPSTTSGWYVPSPGHYVQMLNNLGNDTDTGSYFVRPSNDRYNAIQAVKEKVDINWVEFTWTCRNSDAGNAYTFRTKSTETTFYTRQKNQNNDRHVRPILAF